VTYKCRRLDVFSQLAFEKQGSALEQHADDDDTLKFLELLPVNPGKCKLTLAPTFRFIVALKPTAISVIESIFGGSKTSDVFLKSPTPAVTRERGCTGPSFALVDKVIASFVGSPHDGILTPETTSDMFVADSTRDLATNLKTIMLHLSNHLGTE